MAGQPGVRGAYFYARVQSVRELNTIKSHMRTSDGYVKKTENESTYKLFYCKINTIFLVFRRKTLYSSCFCDIMDEVDGQADTLAPSDFKIGKNRRRKPIYKKHEEELTYGKMGL